MSLDVLQQKLSCKHCGAPRIVTRVSKPTKSKVTLYMACPTHRSEVVYHMPFNLYEQASPFVREHLLLCRKCGNPVDIVGQNTTGRLTKVQIQCPVHGLGERPVNTSLVGMTLDASKPIHTITETPAVAAAGPARFCPSCGIQVAAPEAAFCHNCGASLH